MREICMSGSTRERGAAVIDAIVFHSVLSSLLYRLSDQPHFSVFISSLGTFISASTRCSANSTSSFGPQA